MSPNTIDLRRAAIRYLPSTADCPFADRRCQCLGTIADIRSDAATKRQSPEKKVAASAAITPQLLAPIPDDLRGKHDRSLPLVGFAGALCRSELAAIRCNRLKK